MGSLVVKVKKMFIVGIKIKNKVLVMEHFWWNILTHFFSSKCLALHTGFVFIVKMHFHISALQGGERKIGSLWDVFLGGPKYPFGREAQWDCGMWGMDAAFCRMCAYLGKHLIPLTARDAELHQQPVEITVFLGLIGSRFSFFLFFSLNFLFYGYHQYSFLFGDFFHILH